MNKEQKRQYQRPEALQEILHRELYGKKFALQCGHYITFGEMLGNDLTIRNGKELRVICAVCGYWGLGQVISDFKACNAAVKPHQGGVKCSG